MSELQTLQEKLNSANEHAAHFKAIAAATENTLKDLNSSHEEYKTLSEDAQQKSKEQIDALRKRVVNLESQIAEKTVHLTDLEKELAEASSGTSAKVWVCRDAVVF